MTTLSTDSNVSFTTWDELVTSTSKDLEKSTFIKKFNNAFSGACPVDCYKPFVTYLFVMCLNKFAGATGRASNFLVSMRCVDEKDKPVAMGFGLMLMSLFSFMPSPIFFGYIMDSTCLVWGKTCSGTGNCWLYDAKSLRYLINIIAAVLVSIGTLFDAGVWYYVKDLKIFDDEIKETEMQDFKRDDDEAIVEKK